MDDRFRVLIEVLKATWYDDRLRAIDELTEMGEVVIDRLISIIRGSQFADDRGDYIRGHCAEVLGKIGDTRAFEALVEATEGQSEFLRQKALSALGTLRDVRATGLLVAQLRNHWYPDTREEAAWALANFPEPWVIRVLIRAFGDPHPVVRDAASYALIQIGEAARPDLLIAATSEDALIRSLAKQTLGELEKGLIE